MVLNDIERALAWVWDDWNFGSGDTRHLGRMDALSDLRAWHIEYEEELVWIALKSLDSISYFVCTAGWDKMVDDWLFEIGAPDDPVEWHFDVATVNS